MRRALRRLSSSVASDFPGTYLICGATGAIGSAVARAISRGGGHLLLAGRDAKALAALGSELEAPWREVDFADTAQIKHALGSLPSDLTGVCYAVGSITIKSLRAAQPEDYIASFTLNALGAAETVKTAATALKSNSGSAVFFSSVAVQSGFANHSVISASKGAVEGLTRALAAELAPNTRVNCVAPSLTSVSKMGLSMTANAKVASTLGAAHPLGRLGQPEDSAECACYLLSQRAAWVTGQTWAVDGGRGTVVK